ncbi:hypothetical protein [Citrobacter amalonaticus]|uniref:hypothetical protein n=1 Tax=Citrobacter amalonaticus TaxID=35703 RepID=UPI00300C6F70
MICKNNKHKEKRSPVETHNGTPCRKCGETLRYVSDRNCVACNRTPESNAKVSAALTGIKRSDEFKEKCRVRAKEQMSDPVMLENIRQKLKAITLTCPHCGKTGGTGLYTWHFDYCKQNPNRKQKEQSICPHCKTMGNGGAFKRWHFDNCKEIKDRPLKPRTFKPCPHCGFIGSGGNMHRNHYNNCKHKPNNQE